MLERNVLALREQRLQNFVGRLVELSALALVR